MDFRATCLAVCCLVTWAPLHGQVKVEPWVPIFQGVELATGTSDPAGTRPQKAYAVRVDLRAPGVEVFATPDNAEAPLETTSETTREFLVHHGLQVAINANFYDPCCTPGDKDLIGLAMSRGKLVSPPANRGIGASALVLTRDNRASITATPAGFATDRLWTAVAGSEIVLAGGKKAALAESTFNKATHPRTAVGLAQEGRYLILMVIDGRQAGYSLGATMDEVVDWLLRFGASEGLNLDGGGSTTLVCSEGGAPRVLNHPSGVAMGSSTNTGQEPQLRSNGNNLGVFARPLAVEKALAAAS